MGRLRTLLCLSSFILSLLMTISSFAAADDAAVMSKLLAALSSAPSGWTVTTDCCEWKNVICDGKKRVIKINLLNQSLSDILPSDLGSLSQLTVLSLQGNYFSGPLPSLANLSSLQQLYLDNNKFSSIPAGFFQGLTSLQTLLLSQNVNLAPWTIPTELTQATKLEKLYASDANVIGSLPDISGSFPSLRELLLSNNKLTGSIPESLARLPDLQVLDVSNNDLTGSIPKFASRVKLITTGNVFLGATTPPSSPRGTVAGITIGVVIFVVLFLFVSIRCYVVGKRHRKNERMENPENSMSGGKVFSFQVLARATQNFSEDTILGRGGFGEVYKGELRDGTPIAVKKMKHNGESSNMIRQFQAELAVLTEVRHRHLVDLLGYCISGNERLLVYEYMPKGTLTQHLFEWREKGYSPLSWKQRLTIALDVARGVEYLHSFVQQSFIHRDLKPSNILLGDDMRAKVADFGLVKSVPDGKYSVETRLAGTYGYLAPEYAATGSATTKVDVYAFGVVLEQLITGRKALQNSLPDTTDNICDLVTWFKKFPITKEIIRQAIDETIRPDDEEILESIYKVAELAVLCTASNRNHRPEMTHAVRILGPLVEQWIPTTDDAGESHDIDLEDMSLPR